MLSGFVISSFSSFIARYTPAYTPLAIQELDEKHLGTFSFRTREGFLQVCREFKLSEVHRKDVKRAVLRAIPLPLGQSFWLVCDNFLTSFLLLSGRFCFNWPIKLPGVRTLKAELSSSMCMLDFRQFSTPPLTVTCILIGQLQRKPPGSCQKRCHKTNQNLCPNGNGTTQQQHCKLHNKKDSVEITQFSSLRCFFDY